MNGNKPLLTVCVIGRNEARNLTALSDSLKPLGDLPFQTETLFVDSASTDDSDAVAQRLFNKVFVLEASPRLCASAARNIGTIRASGKWILYLDGDMTLDRRFVDKLASLTKLDPGHHGLVGVITDSFPDGSSRQVRLDIDKTGVVRHFGGPVVLPREMVIRAGNWNPSVDSNEEIDLYTRLRPLGAIVFGFQVAMVTHRTERIPAWRLAVGNLIPGVQLGKKCYGFGQILVSRVLNGGVWNFIRWYPIPFVCWVTMMVAVATAAGFSARAAAVVIALGWGAATGIAGLNRMVMFNLQIAHVILGVWHYDSKYVPRIRVEFDSAAAAGGSNPSCAE